ncbi:MULTISPECIES: N-6 DNA methylase [unclassified Methylophaga]|jgi:type I restriction enzyme M protein|uniref:N-6 DNA methylase n=1 Tax=unclassified Methylophaga TaxID=2629249 RepID=UPI00259C731C|nr:MULTISPECIES: N-6 DNA methylase [unclassified Methylophaga]|tara:strand:+ start:3072 stop:4250 length:1179 start_codon:yes stop_codon:yes gene_type:complete
MIQLNQYYTDNKYGDFLVGKFSSLSPRLALDLGFGSGSLLNAARRRWSELCLIGVDIDNDNVSRAKLNSSIEALNHNGFDPSLPDIIKDKYGDIDLLVGNPPYFSRELDQDAKKILRKVGMLDCLPANAKKVPAELVFIAQNLRLLSKSGELGLIVPAGLISGEKWKPIREFLFTNYNVTNVIQLPTNSFKNTDAQTFILIVKQKLSSEETVSISYINAPQSMQISTKDASNRADFMYYKSTSVISLPSDISENDFFLFRGNKSKNELSILVDNFIHTTDLPAVPSNGFYINTPSIHSNNMQKGDILIARVGRRCLGRTLYVNQGSLPISDCIIGIRPSSLEVAGILWEKLSHPRCRNFLQEVSLGVGAKYITYRTITDYLTTGCHATSREF